MTKQEIYDTVCAHLAQQKTRAMAETRCAYRGQNNTSCAVGCLIKDEEYDPLMDSVISMNVGNLFHRYPKIAERLGIDNLPMLEQLQGAHDLALDADHLKEKLQKVALCYKLKMGAEEQINEWILPEPI